MLIINPMLSCARTGYEIVTAEEWVCRLPLVVEMYSWL